MNTITKDLKPSFGRHEKFVFRYSWLKKGLDAADTNPRIFSDEQAVARLGVGKNMVRSIRHWCLATNMMDEVSTNGRGLSLQPSDLGRLLLPDGAWDPYLEASGTLWLIHWELVSNQKRALVWNLIFSGFYEPEFTKTQLNSFVIRQLDRLGHKTTEAMVRREVDTFLRTYVTTIKRTKREGVAEASLSCPLAELDIIRLAPEDSIYRFDIGPKTGLPAAIIGYALFSYWQRLDLPQRTLTLDDCIYRWGSPGQVFKLDENSMIEYLESLETMTDGAIRLQESAGLHQVYLNEQTDGHEAHAFLHDYYEQHAL